MMLFRAVQASQKILKQKDPVMALMAYRSTPCSTTGYTPAEVMMGRKICTTLPALEKNLQQNWPSISSPVEPSFSLGGEADILSAFKRLRSPGGHSMIH
uniref:Uncharacterized protein n=1 Tax=Mola mola TaxID=94237 RepID=A0A3Q3VS17_MOLML